MIISKHIAAVTAVVTCLSLLLCGAMVFAAGSSESPRSIPEYQNKMFGDEIVTIDIKVDKGDWQNLLDNATAKEWIACDLTINGFKKPERGDRSGKIL